MKERPILFSTEMVRAILDSRKTQTRRAIKPQPYIDDNGNLICGKWNYGQDAFSKPHFNNFAAMKCPYGQPGEKLWVRETWALDHAEKEIDHIAYKADGTILENSKWKPSIHMRREYSRINLEITNIRAERLQDISEEDAKAEGIIFVNHGLNQWGQQKEGWNIKEKAELGSEYCLLTPRFAYGNLWNSINGHGSWDSNPFVWVVEFRRI